MVKAGFFKNIHASQTAYLFQNKGKDEYLYHETILFDSANTCVWHVKQYCLTTQTILFHPSKSNYRKAKRLFYDLDTFIYLHSPPVCMPGHTFANYSFERYFPPSPFLRISNPLWRQQKHLFPVQIASICILRIAWEYPFCALSRRRVQRRAFSAPSFDKLTNWYPDSQTAFWLFRFPDKDIRMIETKTANATPIQRNFR